MQVVDADLELVLQHAGAGAAAGDRLQFVVAAAVGRAAVVVDVVVASAAEVVGHRVAGAAGRAVAAPGEAGVIVDQRAAVRGGHLQMPGVAEAVFVARLRIQRLDADRPGPRLVGEQAMHRYSARQMRAAEQLVARHRALLAVLVFHVQLQGRLRIDVPVRGQRQEIAVAVGVIDIAAQGLVRGVDAQAELALAAEPVAQVHRRAAAAVVVAAQHQAAHVLRALGLVVDHAGRGGDAGQHPGQALEHLHLFLVLQRHVLFAGDGQAVDAVAVGRIQRIAAHQEVLVVADRRVAVADRGVGAQHLAEHAHLAVGQLRAIDGVDRHRRVQQRRVAIAAQAAAVVRLATLHVDRVQFDRGLRAGGRRRSVGGQRRQRQGDGQGQREGVRGGEAAGGKHAERPRGNETKERSGSATRCAHGGRDGGCVGVDAVVHGAAAARRCRCRSSRWPSSSPNQAAWPSR
ncbi:hypothetical protein NB713_003659 [Xanthomonas sacchari]|nr:hypothetical protein [Xanthomonas sacchari]